MNKSRIFANLNGVKRHCFLLKCARYEENCNICGLPVKFRFQDAQSILKVMMKRDDWDDFAHKHFPSGLGVYYAIPINYVLDASKLLDMAIEWCEESKLVNR